VDALQARDAHGRAQLIAELAELLVASHLRPSADPIPAQIRVAIPQTLQANTWSFNLLAQEIGDHPETAYAQLRWARRAVTQAYALTEFDSPEHRDGGELSWCTR
jgi:hypothetical protein